MVQGFKSLNVYQMAFKATLEIFELTKTFPVEEKYSLTDQIRRSSRSVCTCIGEGYRKRKYPRYFSL
jgi:four helix bundle protein